MAWLKDVIGYGSHAARPAAGSEGVLYFETDTDTLFRDNGSTWDTLMLGSISPLTTKGDVFVYGTSDTRLPVGTDGDVLTADSTEALGLKWAASSGSAGALTKITEVVVPSGGQASIDFTSIASTYRHLQITLVGRGTAALNSVLVQLQFNGDTAANYDWQNMAGTGITPSCDGARAQTNAQVAQISAASSPANASGAMQLWIHNYANTAWRKGCEGVAHYAYDDTSSTGFLAYKYSAAWRSTTVITSVKLFLSSGNFAQNTIAALYGLS